MLSRFRSARTLRTLRSTLGTALAIGAVSGALAMPAAAERMPQATAEAPPVVDTFTVRNRTLPSMRDEPVPGWTCPEHLPFLVDRQISSGAPRGVSVVKDPNIHVVIASAPILRGGYALGWSTDPRRAFALHYDPTLESAPQGYVITATCTNEITLAYMP